MSRAYCDDYDDESFPNEGAFWQANAERALSGRRGKRVLAELREALLALPERRLIANAFSTVGKPAEDPTLRWCAEDHRHLMAEQGQGVCTVAAYVWHKRVKAGADPQQALIDLPLHPDYADEPMATEDEGRRAGLNRYLAWTLMYHNDERFRGLSPEDRWQAVMDWLNEQLAPVS